jgi:hypothetical protein
VPTVITMNRWRSAFDYAALHGVRIVLEGNTPPLSMEQELSLEALLVVNKKIKQEIEEGIGCF